MNHVRSSVKHSLVHIKERKLFKINVNPFSGTDLEERGVKKNPRSTFVDKIGLVQGRSQNISIRGLSILDL